MTAPSYRLSSGASGPAQATAQPRPDPADASVSASTSASGGPATAQLRAAWEAYRGNFAGPLKPLSSQPDLNVLANRVGPIVRTGTDFLFGPMLTMEHPTKACQAILEAAWGDDDRRMTMLSKCRINGGVYGHVFVKIVTPKNRKPMNADNPPRLVVQNPELYRVETDPDDCERVTRYICTWQGSGTDANCWYRQTTTLVDPDAGGDEAYIDGGADDEGDDEHWEIQNWERTGGASDRDEDWTPSGPLILWPYPFAPLHDWQNYPNPNDHWGASDVDGGLINLNKQLHLVESNTNAVQYSHGHPWLFGIGTDTSGITPTPGAITDLPAGSSVAAVSASGDVANMMQFAGGLRENMDEMTATPSFLIGRGAEMPKGPVPGITMRLMAMPRLNRMEHERRLYGSGIRELCRRVLILCGQETAAAEEDVVLTWQDPLPQDDLATGQLALAAQQAGMSQHFIICDIYNQDYDTEMAYRQDEQKEAARAAMQGQAPGQGPLFPSASASASMMGNAAGGAPGVSGQSAASVPASAVAGQPSAPATSAPAAALMHPKMVQGRQASQAAAGKKPTANGM